MLRNLFGRLLASLLLLLTPMLGTAQQSGIDKIVVLFPDEPAAKDGSAARQAAVPLSLVP